MSFAFSAFLLLRVSPHKHLQAKGSSSEVLKRWCSVRYGALSYMCVWVLKWFCQMRSFKSTGNIYRIQYLEAPRWFIVRPRVWNSLHFSPTTAECVENGKRRNDGWILKFQQMSYLRRMDKHWHSEIGYSMRIKCSQRLLSPSEIDWIIKSGNCIPEVVRVWKNN